MEKNPDLKKAEAVIKIANTILNRIPKELLKDKDLEKVLSLSDKDALDSVAISLDIGGTPIALLFLNLADTETLRECKRDTNFYCQDHQLYGDESKIEFLRELEQTNEKNVCPYMGTCLAVQKFVREYNKKYNKTKPK